MCLHTPVINVKTGVLLLSGVGPMSRVSLLEEDKSCASDGETVYLRLSQIDLFLFS